MASGGGARGSGRASQPPPLHPCSRRRVGRWDLPRFPTPTPRWGGDSRETTAARTADPEAAPARSALERSRKPGREGRGELGTGPAVLAPGLQRHSRRALLQEFDVIQPVRFLQPPRKVIICNPPKRKLELGGVK